MAEFSLNKSIEILERTPVVLKALLSGLSQEWLYGNEGENTWSPYEVVGHLIVGEKTDWMVRTRIILSDAENKVFEPFDRFAQDNEPQNIPIAELLNTFEQLRNQNLVELKKLNLTQEDLQKEGVHPELGGVTQQELIAAWVAHDLGHIAQISRVMAKQYKNEVGAWEAYLGILKK